MNGKDLLLRFILGGAAVAISYLVTVVSPWEILAGIFAAFPAVMITAVLTWLASLQVQKMRQM